MKTTFLSASAIALALAVPGAFAAPVVAPDSAPRVGVMQTAQATTPANPQQSRPGTNEQGGQRTGDPGTANPPTSMSGAPPAPMTAPAMPSTMPSAAQPTDPTKANEATGMRAGDPGSRQLPSTPGSGPQVGTDVTPGTAPGSMTGQGTTAPAAPKASDSGGMRTGDPGAREQPTNPRPRS